MTPETQNPKMNSPTSHNALVNGTQGRTPITPEKETPVGKLISSEDGKVRGPRYGLVYTAPAGGKGYVAGYRTRVAPNAKLMGAQTFATLKAAQDYAVQVSDV